MKDSEIIYLLLGAIVLSKAIIGFLIVHLLRRKRELKRERTNLSLSNLQLESHISKIEEQQKDLLAAENFKLKILSLASHDLRTPFQELSMLFEYVDVLDLEDAELKQAIAGIKNQVLVSKALLDNVLVWTAGQLRNSSYSKVAFSLREQVNNAINQFAVQSQKKDLHIMAAVDVSQSIFGNVEIFNFVLRNLLSNAIKYSEIGGQIELGLINPGDGSLIFYVRDFGEGMDEGTLQRLQKGEMVESRSGTGNEKGVGLGLSLCQDLLERVGWSLEISSTYKNGSCFSLILPSEDFDGSLPTMNESLFVQN